MATSPILLQLLFLIAGNLLLTTAAPVNDVCLQTKEPQRCVTILMATDERTPTAALPVLEEVAIEAAMYSAGLNKNAADDLFLYARDPYTKGISGNCKKLYQDVLDALLSAPANLQRRNYAKLVEAAGIVERAVSGCAAAFGNNAAFVRTNADASVEAQAIAIIARNLR